MLKLLKWVFWILLNKEDVLIKEITTKGDQVHDKIIWNRW